MLVSRYDAFLRYNIHPGLVRYPMDTHVPSLLRLQLEMMFDILLAADISGRIWLCTP